MHSNQHKFTGAEVFAFTFCSTITLGVAMLPYAPLGYPIRDPWFSLLIAALPYVLYGLLLSLFAKRYKYQEFFDILKRCVFAPVYYPIMIYFLVSSLHFAVLLSTNMVLNVQKHFLVNSNTWLLYVPWFLILGWCLYFGIHTIVTFLRLYIVIEITVLLTVFTVGFFSDFEFVFISPIAATDFQSLLRSTFTDFSWYGGMVSLLAFIHLANLDKKPGRSIQLALSSMVLIYILSCFVSIGTFGYEESMLLTSPIHSLIQTFTPYGQFQRLDLFFMVLWTTSYFKMTLVQLWFSTIILKKVVPSMGKVPIVILITASLFVVLSIWPNMFEVPWQLYHYNAAVFSLIIPIILLAYLILRYRRSTQ